jgi:hypothetical protein
VPANSVPARPANVSVSTFSTPALSSAVAPVGRENPEMFLWNLKIKLINIYFILRT